MRGTVAHAPLDYETKPWIDPVLNPYFIRMDDGSWHRVSLQELKAGLLCHQSNARDAPLASEDHSFRGVAFEPKANKYRSSISHQRPPPRRPTRG